MTHNSTATTPHNSNTAYNDSFTVLTPEARAKDLGGVIVHYKHYTNAKFHDYVAAEYFYTYMLEKNNYEVVAFTGGTLMYRHKTVSPQKN